MTSKTSTKAKSKKSVDEGKSGDSGLKTVTDVDALVKLGFASSKSVSITTDDFDGIVHKAIEYPQVSSTRPTELADADKIIAATLDGTLKDLYTWTCLFTTELNGLDDSMVGGQPKSYIESTAYFQWVEAKVAAFSPKMAMLIEDALNWQALGRGKKGVLGAAVRRSLRPYFSKARECKVTVITDVKLTPELVDILKAYKEAADKYAPLAAVFRANAISLAAQAGTNLYTKVHHWDAKNLKEWDALFGTLGVKEDIDPDDYRSLVYLSIHPIPIHIINSFRRAALGESHSIEVPDVDKMSDTKRITIPVLGYSNTVVLRANGNAAGTAAFCLGYLGCEMMRNEDFGDKLSNAIERSSSTKWEQFASKYKAVRADGESFHILAREYGRTKIEIDYDSFRTWIAIGIAYILAYTKGSLRNSLALKKWKDQNSRTVEIWIARFRKEIEKEQDSISDYLLSFETGEVSISKQVARMKEMQKLASLKEDLAKTDLTVTKSKESLIEAEVKLEKSKIDLNLMRKSGIPDVKAKTKLLLKTAADFKEADIPGLLTTTKEQAANKTLTYAEANENLAVMQTIRELTETNKRLIDAAKVQLYDMEHSLLGMV